MESNINSGMDSAMSLICEVARNFYPTDLVVIIEALTLDHHVTLTDSELATLMGRNSKDVRKLCSKLQADGLLSVHGRPETKQGSNRTITRNWYYINVHLTIDIIKYRLKKMARDIDAKYSQKGEEKKELFCPQCKNEYTHLEVLDEMSLEGHFHCRRCRHILQNIARDDDAEHSGHEVQSRLNAQLAPFERLMQSIDDSSVPDEDFEQLFSRRVPVKRDSNHPRSAESNANVSSAPATVHGLKEGPSKVQVEIVEADHAEKEKERQVEEQQKIREQNELPSWHVTSMVTGEDMRADASSSTVGMKRKLSDDKKDILPLENDEEEKKDSTNVDTQAIDSYYSMMQAEEEEDSEESEDDDDSSDDEDKSDTTSVASPEKRVKLDNDDTKHPDDSHATNGVSKTAADTINGDSKTAVEGDSDEESEDER